jgi:phosphatidylserine decarboxylase
LVALIGVIAVVSLVLGVVLSRFVVSPAQLAAEARGPEAGPVTAPIEERVIQNVIITRADVTYADAVDVKVDTTGLAGPAVVTGHLPEVGATLEAGSVALEVAGRPLLVLPGDLPVYRTLHAGLSGPDVLELKAALASLGFDVGDAASDLFDAATAAAIDSLYRSAGYSSPALTPDAKRQLAGARETVRSASASVDQAVAALNRAASGPEDSELVEADNAVRQAQRELDVALWRGDDETEIGRLRDALTLAETRRSELGNPADVSAEEASVDAARSQLADAQEALAEAETDALTVLPASEVVYLSSLPRRVDSVDVTRGTVATGTAMTVSGATLLLAGSASEGDAALLSSGMAASFTAADGSAYTATVATMELQKAQAGEEAPPSGEKRYDVSLQPQELDDATIERLRGSNVKVSITVQSTSGEVLAVPVAALTAGPGGESRIEVVAGEAAGTGPADVGAVTPTGSTELVTVKTGLSAGGFVEISSDDPRVAADARVVVGR